MIADPRVDSRTRRLVTLGVLALLIVAVVVGAAVSNARGATATPSAAAASAEQELAEKYAPYVVVRVQEEECGEGEPYRPVPVTSVLGDEKVVLRGPDGAEITTAPTAADLAGLDDDYYLDLPGDPLDPGCDYEEWFRTKQDIPTTVYARVTTDAAHPDTVVLQYWFWWVYNDWNDKHEGDWEMIQLLFEADSVEEALATTPSDVAFAQHEGSEVSTWGDAKLLKDGDHVAVYPGQGSHAAYYTQAQWFGKSAAAGFGCDNTGLSDGLSATVLKPQVELIDDDTEWLTFTGRWGEKAPSFNNGPTGPNTKDQWDEPVTWQVDEGRTSAVALPQVLTSAEETFCALTAGGSLLFIDLLDDPVAVLIGIVIVVGLIVLLLRATKWRGGPREPDSERTAGQILVGPFRILRAHGSQYGGVILALMALLLLSYWVQELIQRPVPTDDLATVGEPSVGLVGAGLVALGAVVAIVLTAFAVSYTMGITDGLPDPDNSASLRSRSTRSGMWRTLLSYVLVALCISTVILIPLGIYLIARWAVATPAAVIEDLRVGAAGKRGAALSAGRRWRALAITISIVLIASVPGALAGALLLLITPLSFAVVNVVVLVVTAVAVVFASIAMTLHYYDLRNRSADEDQPNLQEAAA